MPTTSAKYEAGRVSATEVIAKGEDPQHLLNQSLADLDPDDFTRGWQEVCEANGARHPEDSPR